MKRNHSGINTKKKNKKQFPFILLPSIIIGILLTFLFGRKNNKSIEHSKEELQNRYNYLLSHVAQTNVHDFLRPIHFSVGKDFAACGTLILKTNLDPDKIITAAHLFSRTQAGTDYYDYHILSSTGYVTHGHISNAVLDSIRSSDKDEGIHDVAFCYIGDPGLISRTSKVIVSAESPTAALFSFGKIDPVQVTSITTGEKFKIVGQIVNGQNVPFFVMLYEGLNGESGSGFWGSDYRLYILSGNINLTPEIRKAVDIPEKFKYVTVLSAVKINW
jgi:hypothetical protein